MSKGASSNGLIIGKGEEVGVPMPCQEVIVAIMHRVERGKLKPSPGNIKGF